MAEDYYDPKRTTTIINILIANILDTFTPLIFLK
jgi:hypothetical protein